MFRSWTKLGCGVAGNGTAVWASNDCIKDTSARKGGLLRLSEWRCAEWEWRSRRSGMQGAGHNPGPFSMRTALQLLNHRRAGRLFARTRNDRNGPRITGLGRMPEIGPILATIPVCGASRSVPMAWAGTFFSGVLDRAVVMSRDCIAGRDR